MSAEPRPGFRGRVLGRLGRPASSWFALPRLAAAAAAILVVGVAFQLTRQTPQPAPSATPAQTLAESRPETPPARGLEGPATAERPEAAPPATTSPGAAPAQASPGRAPVRPPDRSQPSAPRFPAQGRVTAATVAGAALAPAATIDGVPVPLDADAEPIIIEPLAIAPLAIEPLVVAPLWFAR